MQRDKLRVEQARCMEALKSARKPPKIIVDELATLETAIDDLDGKIADARERVQPLVMARTLADFEVGDASVFSGDAVRDRAFVRELVNEILVYTDGSIVVKFKQATLLAPMSQCRIDPTTPAGAGTLAESRTTHQREFECTVGMLQMLGAMPEPPAEATLSEGADAVPSYAVKPTGAWPFPLRDTDGIPSGSHFSNRKRASSHVIISGRSSLAIAIVEGATPHRRQPVF